MELLYACIGRTRTHEIDGQPVATAYLKEAVPGPWHVEAGGLAGNEVAVHTDALYAYSRDSYRHWAARLGRAAAEWPPGTFAENFGFDVLDESGLRIGDVLALGDEVRLVVAGPRVPCFKLTWRLGQPETFLREFALSGRTGVYFGVLAPGTVARGDRLRFVERAADAPTVPDVARMIFGSEPVAAATLERVLALPALSRTAALVLGAKLNRTLDLERTRAHRWRDWRRFRVASVRDECADVRSFVLEPADGGPLAAHLAGQFVTVRLPEAAGRDVVRTWTCSDYASPPAAYRLSVKRESHGVASRWLHDHAMAGTELDVRAPAGRFVLDRSGFKPVVLIAAGIGVTPLLPMLKAHVERGPDAPLLYFVHCVRDGGRHPFRAEMDALVAAHPRCRAHYVYSAPAPADVPGRDYHQRGRFVAEDLYRLMADSHLVHGGRRIDLPWFESDIYLCGPAGFQEALRSAFIAAGARAERVFVERFAVARGAASARSVDRAEVYFAKSQVRAEWHAADDASLLELAERHGLAPESGCRVGVCHACRCRLASGEVSYDAAPLEPMPPDAVLPCMARPATSRVVLDL